jgi:DNA/RNA endonuclease G (NUC1)
MKHLLFIFSWLLFVTGSKAQHTITVKHTYYTLEYDTVLKSPIVSWYIQTTAHATSANKVDRKTVASFHQDPLIPSKYQCANDAEYLNNGHFDKGHLSPYSAFYFDIIAAKESMYYTNTSPQYSFFNEHSWEKLEQYVLKTLSPKIDSIYVYTGCLYGNNKMKDVPVPDYYWKVIEYKNGEECWVAPNVKTTYTYYHSYSINVQSLKYKIHSYYPSLILPF